MIVKNDNKFYLNYTLFISKNAKGIKNKKYVSETFFVNTRLLSSNTLPKANLTDIEINNKSINNKSNFKSYLGKNNTLTQVLFKNNKNKYFNSVIDTNARVSLHHTPENWMKYKLVKKNLVEKNNMSLPLFLRNNYYQASSTNTLIKPYINSKLLEVNNRYNSDKETIKNNIKEGRIKIKQNSNPIINKYLKYLRKPIKFTFISTDHNKEKIDTFFNDLKNEINSKRKLQNKNTLSSEVKSNIKINKITEKYKLKIVNIFNTNSDLLTFENYLWKKEDSQWVFSKIEESKINNIIEEINKFAIKKMNNIFKEIEKNKIENLKLDTNELWNTFNKENILPKLSTNNEKNINSKTKIIFNEEKIKKLIEIAIKIINVEYRIKSNNIHNNVIKNNYFSRLNNLNKFLNLPNWVYDPMIIKNKEEIIIKKIEDFLINNISSYYITTKYNDKKRQDDNKNYLKENSIKNFKENKSPHVVLPFLMKRKNSLWNKRSNYVVNYTFNKSNVAVNTSADQFIDRPLNNYKNNQISSNILTENQIINKNDKNGKSVIWKYYLPSKKNNNENKSKMHFWKYINHNKAFSSLWRTSFYVNDLFDKSLFPKLYKSNKSVYKYYPIVLKGLPSVGINNINNYNTIYKRLKLNMKNNNSKGNFIMGFNKPKNIRRNNNIISYGYKALGKWNNFDALLAFKYRFATPFEAQEININNNNIKNNNLYKLENQGDQFKYNSLFKGIAIKKKIKLDIKNYKDWLRKKNGKRNYIKILNKKLNDYLPHIKDNKNEIQIKINMFKLLTDVRIKLLKKNKIVSHIINTTQTKNDKFKNIKEGITFNNINKKKFSVPYWTLLLYLKNNKEYLWSKIFIKFLKNKFILNNQLIIKNNMKYNQQKINNFNVKSNIKKANYYTVKVLTSNKEKNNKIDNSINKNNKIKWINKFINWNNTNIKNHIGVSDISNNKSIIFNNLKTLKFNNIIDVLKRKNWNAFKFILRGPKNLKRKKEWYNKFLIGYNNQNSYNLKKKDFLDKREIRFLKRIKLKKKIQHNHEVPLLNSNPWYVKLKKSNNKFNQNKIGNISEIKGRKFLNDKLFNGWEGKKQINTVYKFLASSFKAMNSLISYPTLIITPNKIKVKLYYYMLIHKVIKRKNKFKKILRNHFKIKGAKGIGMVYKKQDLKNYLSYNFYKINKIRDNNQLKSLINTKEITLKEDQYKINTLKNRLGGPEEILRNYKINLILDNRFKKYNPEFNLINNIKINNTIDVKSNSEENIKFKIDSKIKNLPVNNSIFNDKFKSNNKIKFQIENIENQDILKKENRKPSVRKFNEDKINKQDNIMNLNLNNKLYSTNNLNSGKKVDRNSGIITSNIKNKRENKVQEIGNKKFISTSNKSNNYQNNYYSIDKFISDNKIIKKNNFKSNLKDKFLVDFKNKNKMPHNLFILGENFRSNFFSRKQELNTVKENNNFNITLKSKLRFRRIIEIIKNKEISKYSSNYNDIKNKRNKAIKFYNINNKLIKDKKMEDFKILKLLITLRNKIKQIKLNKINTNKIKLNFTYKYKFDRIWADKIKKLKYEVKLNNLRKKIKSISSSSYKNNLLVLISNNNTKLFKPLNNLITLRTNNKKKLDTKRIKRRIAIKSNIKSNFINNNGKEIMSIKKFKGNKINNQFRGFSLRRRFIKALKKNKYKSKSFAKRKFRNRFKKFKFRRNLRKLKKARLRWRNKVKFKSRVKMLKSHYSSNNFLTLFQNKMDRICQILSYFFQKPIDLEIIRLHYPYNNTRILVNLIGYMINKKRVQYLIRKIIKNSRFDDYNRKIVIYNKNKIERTRHLTEKMKKNIINKDNNNYDIYKKNKIKILKKNKISTNYNNNNNINGINNKIKNLNEIITIKKWNKINKLKKYIRTLKYYRAWSEQYNVMTLNRGVKSLEFMFWLKKYNKNSKYKNNNIEKKNKNNNHRKFKNFFKNSYFRTNVRKGWAKYKYFRSKIENIIGVNNKNNKLWPNFVNQKDINQIKFIKNKLISNNNKLNEIKIKAFNVNKYLNKRNRRKKLNTNNKNIIDAIKEEDTLRKYKKLFKEEKNYYNNVINKYNNYNYSNDNDKEDNKFIINNKSDIIGQKLMYAWGKKLKSWYKFKNFEKYKIDNVPADHIKNIEDKQLKINGSIETGNLKRNIMYVLPTSIVVNNNIKSKYKTLINDEKIKKNIELDNNHISKKDINNKKNTEFNKRRLNWDKGRGDSMPTFKSGITFRAAGRFKTQRVIPRYTTYKKHLGRFSQGKVNFTEFARYTNKTKRGTFSFTIHSCYNWY